jgi:ferritin-like metal-binding protein YciE
LLVVTSLAGLAIERRTLKRRKRRSTVKLETLQELYVEELKDLYSAESQILKALPKMAKAANCDDLRNGFQEHLKQTEGHVSRLEKIFEELGESPKGKVCKGMQGLLEEGAELMEEDASPEVLDAGMISAAQRVEHYEMAGYGTCFSYAMQLGYSKAAGLLEQTLKEEKETDKKLTQLAISSINLQAAEAGATSKSGRAAA